MSLQEVAIALARFKDLLIRRPALGPHPDSSATATWQGGLRVVARHPEGYAVITDMPGELGGGGEG